MSSTFGDDAKPVGELTHSFCAKRYRPGDIAFIYPEAQPEEVDAFLIQMGWANDADEILQIRVVDGGMRALCSNVASPNHFSQSNFSLRTCLTY